MFRQTKILSPENVARTKQHIQETSPDPTTDILMFELSLNAGLNHTETANMSLDAVLDEGGQVAEILTVRSAKAERAEARTIPMHPDLRKAIEAFVKAHPGATRLAIKPTGELRTALHVARRLQHIYRGAGLTGFIHRAGRRTFVAAARRDRLNPGETLRNLFPLRDETAISFFGPSVRFGPDAAPLFGNQGSGSMVGPTLRYVAPKLRRRSFGSLLKAAQECIRSIASGKWRIGQPPRQPRSSNGRHG